MHLFIRVVYGKDEIHIGFMNITCLQFKRQKVRGYVILDRATMVAP